MEPLIQIIYVQLKHVNNDSYVLFYQLVSLDWRNTLKLIIQNVHPSDVFIAECIQCCVYSSLTRNWKETLFYDYFTFKSDQFTLAEALLLPKQNISRNMVDASFV